MKLYTEEEIKKLLKEQIIFDDEDFDKLTPIELPSDEEIEEIAMGLYGFKATSVKDVLEYKAFKRGARLILNKIQGGNK